jgi:hypothetical protein
MDLESRALAAGQAYRFQLRLTLGTVAPVATPSRTTELAAGVRRAGDVLGRRAEAVAGALDRLGPRGWRPDDAAPAGREVLAPHGFAGVDGSSLPEAVAVVREATPEEVARDLAEAGGDLAEELGQSLAVRVEGLDIPARLDAGPPELRYSPKEYLETFSIRV